jgi:hypothetical protein
MDRLNIQYYYVVGFTLGRLHGITGSGDWLNRFTWSASLEPAIQWMKNFAADDTTPLPKTKKAAAVLLGTLENFSELLGQKREATVDESGVIFNAITAFYHVFEQEVEDAHCLVVRPVGAYAVSALMENACSHLSQSAQKVVSPGVRADFNRAGECLALDLYTACGFHAMRAVEAEARMYHMDVTGVSLTDVPLGTLIYGDQKNYPNSGLRTQHAKEGNSHDSPLGLVVSLLSQINAIYRRPIMHPDMALEEQTAKFVFDTSAIAISAMVTDALTRFAEKEKAADAAKTPAKALTQAMQP